MPSSPRRTCQSTKLASATLNGIKSGGVLGKPASLPKGHELVHGYLVGPRVNLTRATLQKLNLATVNLTGANLTGRT